MLKNLIILTASFFIIPFSFSAEAISDTANADFRFSQIINHVGKQSKLSFIFSKNGENATRLSNTNFYKQIKQKDYNNYENIVIKDLIEDKDNYYISLDTNVDWANYYLYVPQPLKNVKFSYGMGYVYSISMIYNVPGKYVISRHEKELVIDQIVQQLQKLNFITSNDDKNFDALGISKNSTIMKKDNILVVLDGLNDFNNDIIIKVMENNVKQKLKN